MRPPADSPAALYRAAIDRGALQPDSGQAAVVDHLERLHAELAAPPVAGGRVLDSLGRLVGRAPPRAPVRGLYLWGEVGRGKTHLVNLLHDALPFPDKLRTHFHSFMEKVHGDLKSLRGRQDPLAEVASGVAREARVLFFDEFHVADITDAMLLGRLLGALFERGVTLVATSNVAPDALYRDGLQRARFLPAIELIERHTEVVRIDTRIDYRLRALERARVYHCPLDDGAERALEATFARLAPAAARADAPIEIAGRPIATRCVAEGVAWFDFEALCEGPRSAADYVQIARRFHTVLLAGVPRLDDAGRDRTLRLIHLVDVLYDRNVNLVVSAAAAPAELYAGCRLAQRFARTRSRLEEMRSREYLARPHLP